MSVRDNIKPILLICLFFLAWESIAQTQIITTPGSGQFTVPSGVTSITVEVWGAGGRGGSMQSTGQGGGGGGGAYSRSVISVSPNQIIDYYVGFGSLTIVDGEDSWFSSNTFLMAKGGNSVATDGASGATGGLAADGFGDVKYSGGNGANSDGSNGGGGGSSAGPFANGTNGSGRNGGNAPTDGGNGGNGKNGGQGRGTDGDTPGGGGGGAKRTNASGTEQVGGYGADGQIRISYIRLTSADGTDSQTICEGDPITDITYTIPPGSTGPNPTLPSGLSIDYNPSAGTISITGTPTASGTYTLEPTTTYNIDLIQTGSVTISPIADVNDAIRTVCSGNAFSVSPIDGVDGVVPTGTTYSWSAPSVTGGLTGGTGGSGASFIGGTLTNPTNTAQTATYTVTPSTNGCAGPDFTVTVTVDPIATINDLTAEICSGDTFTVNPSNGTDGIIPSGTTYSWSAPSVTGGITGGTAGSGSNISGTLSNPTNTPQTATYTVTPTSGTCAGPTFEVTVTINPGANINDMAEASCSGEAFSITPQDGIDGFVPSGTTYTWSAPTVTGGVSGGAAGSGTSISGTLSNPTSSAQTATYTVTPTSGSCGGASFEIVVTVNPKADITDMAEAVCSDGSFNVSPIDAINGIVPAGTTYSWLVPSVTGGLTGGIAGSGSTITGTLTNPTNTSQTATYTVTPISGTCTGPTFDLVVTVAPTPSINDLTTDMCTGDTFTVTPSQGTDGIIPPGTDYTWSPPAVTGGITGGAGGSGTNIFGTLSNPTNSAQTATYTVTPTSGSCTGFTFEVTVTVNPSPDIMDIGASVCSEESFSVTPQNGVDGIVPASTTYSWSAPSVTGGLTGGTAGSGTSITGNLTNPTDSQQTATYTVTPTSGSCSGSSFEVTITVDPQASVNDLTTSVCSAGTFTVIPANGTDGIIPTGTSYSWSAPSVTGGLAGGAAGSGNSITGTLINPTNSSQTATYIVTPTTNGCIGPDFMVTVTVDPVATINTISANICTGGPFDISPSNGSDGIVPAGTTYSWGTPSVTGGITGGAAGSGSTISGNLTNPTSTSQTATYTVTPTSGSCVGSSFNVVITVDPITAIDTQPSTADEVECFGDGFTSISVGAVGANLSYQWYSNSTASNVGGTVVAGATSASFTPPSTPIGINYYYVVVTGNCGSVTSDPSGQFRVNPPETVIDTNPSTTDQTQCLNGSFAGAELTVLASGEGTVTYQWYSNTANSNTGGTLISGATSATFTPPADTEGTLYYYAVASSNCGTVPTGVSGAYTVTPLTSIDSEALAGQTICEGGIFSSISVVADGTAPVNYQWYRNDQNSTTTGNITAVGTDSDTYTPANDLGTYYYFVEVSSGCGTDVTSSVSGAFVVNQNTSIDVQPSSTTPGSVCIGGAFPSLSVTASGTGSLTYQWYSSTENSTSSGTITPVGTNSNSFTPPSTTDGSLYYFVIVDSDCGSPVTSTVSGEHVVNPPTVITTQPVATSLCQNTTGAELTVAASGTGSITYEWFSNTSNTTVGGTSVGTGPSFSIPTSVDGSTFYYAIASSPVCGSATSDIVEVVVTPETQITVQPIGETVCQGIPTASLTATAIGTGTISYEWFTNTTGLPSGGTSVSTSQSYQPPSTTVGSNYYYVVANSDCSSDVSDVVEIVVTPGTQITSNPTGATYCFNDTPTDLFVEGSGTGTITYEWFSNGTTNSNTGGSSVGTGQTFTPPTNVAGTTYYYAEVTSSTCGTIATPAVAIVINPEPTPTFTEEAGPNVCAEIEEVTYTTESGQSNYVWTIPGTEGTDYNITSGGIGTNSNSVSLIWVNSGTKTVEVSYTDSSTGCVASVAATSITDVEALATVGETSVESPSVCISSPALTQFTQPVTGVTSIDQDGVAGANGLPPGVSATYNSSTGNIEFSGNVSGATTGLYTYNIPLNGNCIAGIEATGTIDVTPNYELTSTTAISATASGGTARVIINGTSTNLPDGEYVVTYELNDGTTAADYTSASFIVSNGRGVFATIPLTDLDVDAYQVTIKDIRKTTDVCTISLDPNDNKNIAFFSVCGATFDASGTFTVPAGIDEITISARGGGTAGETGEITIPVNPGEPLGVFVGDGGGSGTARDTYVTRDSSDPDPQSTSLIYLQGQGGTSQDGAVIISYSCPDADESDCIDVIDDGAVSGTTIIRFECDDSWDIPEGLTEFTVYAIGGGGGGGMGPTGGGGGAGGYSTTTVVSTSTSGIPGGQSLDIVIGQGGTGATTANVKGNNGDATTVSGTISDPGGDITVGLNSGGGGGGGSFNNLDGSDGASGGGGAFSDQTTNTMGVGGSGISGQGNSGGNGGKGNGASHARAGGGGGGVGAVGGVGDGAGVGLSKPGDGGEGSSFTIAGFTYGFGAGGGGIGFNFNGNSDRNGLGGEVNGVILGGTASEDGVGGDGTTFTGSGGGAGRLGGGAGGSGVVFIVYENFRILPVEFLYFEAELDEFNRSGKLNWATASEWENDRFEIERSINNITDWEVIGEVKGAGNSEEVQLYDFTDTKLPAGGGDIFYRLKQVNYDGEFSYSETRAIQVKSLPGVTSWKVFPNPTTGNPFNIELLDSSVYGDEEVTIRVISPTGQFMNFEIDDITNMGSAIGEYLERMPPGLYTIEIAWGEKREYHKVILRK